MVTSVPCVEPYAVSYEHRNNNCMRFVLHYACRRFAMLLIMLGTLN